MFFLVFRVDHIYNAASSGIQCFANEISPLDSENCALDSKISTNPIYEWSAWEETTANTCIKADVEPISWVVISRQQKRACSNNERLQFVTNNEVTADCERSVVRSYQKRAELLQNITNSRLEAQTACQALNSTLFTGS